MMKKAQGAIEQAARLVLLGILLIAAVATLRQHNRSTPQTAQVFSVYSAAIQQLDAHGRLPLDGDVAGEINNLYQVVRHPANPALMGCGDQAAFVYARLSTISGWVFEMRYESGLRSPILLPHQWITGHGPHGETVQIDPWSGRFEQVSR